MTPNYTAANVLGTMGTICWTAQVLPQIWKSWREKSTKGMSDWLMLLWGLSSVPLGAYSLLRNLNLPLVIQPQLFGLMCLISWGQCQFYERQRSVQTSVLMTIGMALLCGGIETTFVLTVRQMSNEYGKEVATKAFGVLSAVVVSSAVFPQYYEIYKHRAVMGISLLVLVLDMLGGLLNDLSLVFSEDFDVLAAVSYTAVIVLDGVIVALAAFFKFRNWRHRKHARNLSAAEPLQPALDIGSQESRSRQPLKEDRENVQHLTVLSRVGLRLSDTPGPCTWTVLIGDTVQQAQGQRVGTGTSEKASVGVVEIYV